MRTERDTFGEMTVPDDALYGASTARAIRNFPISGRPMPEPFLRSLALVKAVCARTNEELGRLDPEKSRLIQQAAAEIAAGGLLAHFPVDVFQTGSGTSTNTNMNEVIANRASQLAGAPIGSQRPVHPNDDVNLGQSSNDVMPTALHVGVALALRERLRPALVHLQRELADKAEAFAGVVKAGRTHLMDATPLTLGQEFSGYAAQAAKSVERTDRAVAALQELAIGGTAVGTGLNGHPDFAGKVCTGLAGETGIRFLEARNHFEAQAARDGAVEAAGHLATIAGSLTKIANDLRLLGSGPRCGLAEIQRRRCSRAARSCPGRSTRCSARCSCRSAFTRRVLLRSWSRAEGRGSRSSTPPSRSSRTRCTRRSIVSPTACGCSPPAASAGSRPIPCGARNWQTGRPCSPPHSLRNLATNAPPPWPRRRSPPSAACGRSCWRRD